MEKRPPIPRRSAPVEQENDGVIEGRNAVIEALRAGVTIDKIFIAKGEIKINLPASEAGQKVTANDNPRLVQVDNAGVLYWDGKIVTEQELDEAVRTLSRQENVVLRIDKDSKFEHFITVIDVFKKYRHENFRIATEHKAA